jgi:hypothetical protein
MQESLLLREGGVSGVWEQLGHQVEKLVVEKKYGKRKKQEKKTG